MSKSKSPFWGCFNPHFWLRKTSDDFGDLLRNRGQMTFFYLSPRGVCRACPIFLASHLLRGAVAAFQEQIFIDVASTTHDHHTVLAVIWGFQRGKSMEISDGENLRNNNKIGDLFKVFCALGNQKIGNLPTRNGLISGNLYRKLLAVPTTKDMEVEGRTLF